MTVITGSDSGRNSRGRVNSAQSSSFEGKGDEEWVDLGCVEMCQERREGGKKVSEVRGGAVHWLTDEWKRMGRSAFGMLFKQFII